MAGGEGWRGEWGVKAVRPRRWGGASCGRGRERGCGADRTKRWRGSAQIGGQSGAIIAAVRWGLEGGGRCWEGRAAHAAGRLADDSACGRRRLADDPGAYPDTLFASSPDLACTVPPTVWQAVYRIVNDLAHLTEEPYMDFGPATAALLPGAVSHSRTAAMAAA